jgi:hypothetical protein
MSTPSPTPSAHSTLSELTAAFEQLYFEPLASEPLITMASGAPDLAGIPTYDGTGTTRFLRRLRAKFALVGEAQINPIYFVSAIETSCSDLVIKALESNATTSAILDNPAVGDDNVATIQAFLYAKYPDADTSIEPVDAQQQLESLKQQPDEILEAYHYRASEILGLIGGRDSPRNNQPGFIPLTQIEQSVLTSVIKKFGLGIYDNALRKAVLSSEKWYTTRTLHGALELAQNQASYLKNLRLMEL